MFYIWNRNLSESQVDYDGNHSSSSSSINDPLTYQGIYLKLKKIDKDNYVYKIELLMRFIV